MNSKQRSKFRYITSNFKEFGKSIRTSIHNDPTLRILGLTEEKFDYLYHPTNYMIYYRNTMYHFKIDIFFIYNKNILVVKFNSCNYYQELSIRTRFKCNFMKNKANIIRKVIQNLTLFLTK